MNKTFISLVKYQYYLHCIAIATQLLEIMKISDNMYKNHSVASIGALKIITNPNSTVLLNSLFYYSLF